jgi:NitT/TauT family transport system substrate-binding protein
MTRSSRGFRRTWRAGAALTALALTAAACGGDDSSSDTTAAASTEAPATTTAGSEAPATTVGGDTTAPAGFDQARCDANKAVGKITYSSSFDFAAAASIIDVVVAKEKGYFDDLCLDVDLVPGFSTTNYPLVTAGTAQFSSAGNYTEILNFSTSGSEFVAIVDYGKAPIEALVTPEGGATALAELKGKNIGVKGDLPPSIVALLATHGLSRGTDYKEILLDGFDPVSQLAQVDALPVYKSNEPGQLDRAGVKYNIFDPAAESIPGTFGLLYTSKEFYEKNPTVVEDFTRAALKGMEDAIADPAGAVALSVAQIDAGGNQNFLTEEGETYRWTQEMQAVLDSTPAGEPVGLIDGDVFKAEYDAYVSAGVWPDGAPEYTESYSDSPAKAAYGADGKVIWP